MCSCRTRPPGVQGQHFSRCAASAMSSYQACCRAPSWHKHLRTLAQHEFSRVTPSSLGGTPGARPKLGHQPSCIFFFEVSMVGCRCPQPRDPVPRVGSRSNPRFSSWTSGQTRVVLTWTATIFVVPDSGACSEQRAPMLFSASRAHSDPIPSALRAAG